MHYRLRTLMILLAVLPPLLAWGWIEYSKYREREAYQQEMQEIYSWHHKVRSKAPHV